MKKLLDLFDRYDIVTLNNKDEAMTSAEYDKLTDEEIRIKVAEFDGWEPKTSKLFDCPVWINKKFGGFGRLGTLTEGIPDYLNDLNAIHEAIMGVPQEGNFVIEFERNLILVLKDDEEQPANPFLWMAKAGQLCEAFVLTMEE